MVSVPPSPASGKRRRLHGPRGALGSLVLLTLVVLVFRTWFVEGTFAPLAVVSGSMAETLLGPHREVVCGDCGFSFVCGIDVARLRSRAVCPNCGSGENSLGDRPDIGGDRLLVDKAVFGLRRPRRWELVAFRHPERAREIHVKRVVGLPGESIQIRDGDVYVNGEIQRKTLDQQRALAVLVHDAGHRPRREPLPPARWRHEEGETGWRRSRDGGFVHAADPGATSVDWLGYFHWRRVPGGAGETVDAPILNERGYNQTYTLRADEMFPVDDVLLSFRLVRTFGSGQFFVRAGDGAEEFLVRIDSDDRTFEVLRDGRPVSPPCRGKLPGRLERAHLEVSLIDDQFLLAVDGEPVAACPYEPGDRPADVASPPLAIGSRGLGVELRDLRVYRDVYYTRPIGRAARWGLDEPVRLAPDEYFVLGDNSPISIDSRNWVDGPGVPERLLVGRPFFVHFPTRPIEVGRWRFQVPDLARIRCIR